MFGWSLKPERPTPKVRGARDRVAEEIVEPTPVQINELPRAATNKTSRADRQELTNQETHRPVRSTPGTLVFHCG